jgi:hypothetical protein
MNNNKFSVSLEENEKTIHVRVKNSPIKIKYSNSYDRVWIKQYGLVFLEKDLLTFVGKSMVTIDISGGEVPMELYELRSEGHYIFVTSHRHIHFHIEGATHIYYDALQLTDMMNIEDVHKNVIDVEDIKPLLFICGLIL